jgi:multiple sugar transport system substrate-binding protein
MLINLDVMDKAGVALPPLDWTWDDYVRIVKAVTKGEGTDKVYGFGFDPSTISSILPWVWGNGGDIFSADRAAFTLDRPQATDAIQRLADLYRQGYMPVDTVSATTDILDRWFVNNRIAMREGAANNILNLQKVDGLRFEAWPMPGGTVKRSTLYKSNITALGSRIKDVDEAWDLLKFLRAPDGQGETLYMNAKRVPPSIDDAKYWSLYADPTRYPKMIERNSKEIARTYGHNLPLRAGWLEVEQIVKPMIQSNRP